ncbi:hypothetical protein M1N11_01995 [Peptococcaceae bacterium]|nr:hypothetical protein [Peptococcaceae bacterium]
MKYKINLLPLELQPKKINVKLFAAVFFLASFFVLAAVSIGMHTWKIYQENIKLQEKISRLQQEYEMEKQVAFQMESLIAQRKKWEAQIQNFNHLISIRKTWSGLLREIHNCVPVPKDLWFELVEIKYEGLSNAINKRFEEENEKNKITIKGKSMSVESIGKFVYKLNQIKDDIELSNIKLVEIKRGEFLYYDEMLTEEVPDVYEFTISADLKHKDI